MQLLNCSESRNFMVEPVCSQFVCVCVCFYKFVQSCLLSACHVTLSNAFPLAFTCNS